MAATLGSVRSESVRFLESAGSAAGVYSSTFAVPAGAFLVDVIIHADALWTADTSATLIVGDTAVANGVFAAVNLKATDIIAGESISVALAGGKAGADIANSAFSRRKVAAATAARNLTAEITTVGTVGTAGDTTIIWVYAYPSPMACTFTASA